MKVHVAMMLTLSLGLQGCQRSPASRAAQSAANTPEQTRLWQQAADQKLAPGLEKLSPVDRPVQARQPAVAADQAIPPAQGSLLPATVVSGVRIISTAALGDGEFSGPATVIDVTGERVSLNLGGNRTITFQARADGRALTITPGQTMRMEYRVRSERLNRRQILAVRAPDGTGIARITETGSSPVSVAVPLFGLVATQVAGNPTSVDVRVGADRKTLVPGEIAKIGGVSVGLMASSANTGPEARASEGSPYSIDLIAWSSP